MSNNVFRILCLILIPLNLFVAFHAKFDTLNFVAALYMLIVWGYMEWRVITMNEIEKLKRQLKDSASLIEVITKENFKYRKAFKEIKHILKINEQELYETLHTPIDEMILKIIDEVLI